MAADLTSDLAATFASQAREIAIKIWRVLKALAVFLEETASTLAGFQHALDAHPDPDIVWEFGAGSHGVSTGYGLLQRVEKHFVHG